MVVTVNLDKIVLDKPVKNVPSLNDSTGNAVLIKNLLGWGVYEYHGVNGGGVIHLAKYLKPIETLKQVNAEIPHLFNINEDIASFIPLGIYWASGRMAASLFTTGGAALIGETGLYAAKVHNIPMVAVVALSASDADVKAPLQYTGKEGSNTIGIYRELLGDGCIVLNNIGGLEEKLVQGRQILQESKPVAFLFHPDVLSKKVQKEISVPLEEKTREVNESDISEFLSMFPDEISSRRVIIYVGEEAAKPTYRNRNIQDLIADFSVRLQAPTIYSMNSVNAVSLSNPFAAGYIHLGFNDFSFNLWKSLTKDDVVVCIGYDPGEYEMNSDNIPGNVWHLTKEVNPYSSKNGGFAHRVDGRYKQVKGDLELTLKAILEGLKDKTLHNIPVNVPENLNTNEDYGPFAKGTVDLVKFYKTFSELVKHGTIIVNDVCQAYKDFQRVTMRPLAGVEVYSSHRDSFMSGGYGVAIGTKFGCPNKEVEYFTGDGCFRYFGATLSFIKNLGIGIWVIDNGNYHIVDKGLDVIYGESLDKERHHATLPRDDYAAIAKAQHLDGYHISHDLSNLNYVMQQKYANSVASTPISTLIQIPIDGNRVVGQNARLYSLGKQGQSNL